MSYTTQIFSNIVKNYLSREDRSGNHKEVLVKLARQIQKFAPNLSREEKFYCYVYLDPRYPGDYEYVLPSGKVVKFKHRPFYVGKGLGRRATTHTGAYATTRERGHKANLIRKIIKAGLTPIIQLTRKRTTESRALAFEVDLIAGIGRTVEGGPLTNKAFGGPGGSGQIITKAQRRAIGLANRGPKTKEHREAISRSLALRTDEERKKRNETYRATVRNRTQAEHKRILKKNSVAHKGMVPSEETKARQRETWARKSAEELAEIVAKVQSSRAGYRHSAETKRKMTVAQNRRSAEELAASCAKGWETRRSMV